MTDTTASIAGKGCQGTGITEEIAERIADAEAGNLVCIAQISYSALHKKKGGKRKVELVIDYIEPATDSFAADYLREVQKTLHNNRALDGHHGTTTGGTEPTVAEVLANGQRFKSHPFLPVSAGENDQPICDVCGLLETAPIHSKQVTLDDPDEDDETTSDDEATDEQLEIEEPEWEPDENAHDGTAYDTEPDPDSTDELDEAGDPTTRKLAPVPNPFTP